MGRVRAVLALVLGACSASAPASAEGPRRVMSLNLCADQLVLALLPPERIASVTWLARDPASSWMAAAAHRVASNHGLAEEVVRDRPDLIVAGSYTTPATWALLKRLHYRLVVLQPDESFADVERNIRRVAAAVGEREKGDALIGGMRAELARLRADPAPPLRVAAWDGAGFSARPGSLYNAILEAAGARNVVNETGRYPSGAPDIELLLATAPQLLVESEPRAEKPGPRRDTANHPLIRHFWSDRAVIVRQAATVCGTPFSAAAARSLRDQMRAKLAQARTPLPFLPSLTR